MNLENCVDNMGLEKAAVHSSRRNLLINKSYSNLSNNFASRKPQLNANTMINPSSSHLNLFKSSNSLNALDLDLMESVSVGSFDRLSLYSCGGVNSESDLNQCFLVEMINDVVPTTKNRLKMKTDEAESSRNNRVTSIGLSNFKENRVIDWLENI